MVYVWVYSHRNKQDTPVIGQYVAGMLQTFAATVD